MTLRGKRRDPITQEQFDRACRQLEVEKRRRPSVRELMEKLEGGSPNTIRRFLADRPGTETWKRAEREMTMDMHFREPDPNIAQLGEAYKTVVLEKFENVWPGSMWDKRTALAEIIRTSETEVHHIARGERAFDLIEFVLWCSAAKLDPTILIRELIDKAKATPARFR